MTTLTAFVAAIAVTSAGCLQPQSLDGKKAPAITGQTVDGSQFDLATAIKKGPVLVYFISTTCPVTDEATKFYDRLAKAYPNATVVGVANASKPEITKWNKLHTVSFKILPDPNYKVIDAYAVKAAPTSFLINKQGVVVKTWFGYSLGYLQETNGMIARLLNTKAASVNFTGASKNPVAG